MSKIIIDLHTISLRRAKATAGSKNETDAAGETGDSVDALPLPSPETIAYKNKDKILSGINKTLEEQGQLTEGKSVDL
jgi:hypothetical protein